MEGVTSPGRYTCPKSKQVILENVLNHKKTIYFQYSVFFIDFWSRCPGHAVDLAAVGGCCFLILLFLCYPR